MSKVYNDLRRAYLTHDNIAIEAYFVWERSGKPIGESEKHWFVARDHLEIAAEMDAEQISSCGDIGKQIFVDGRAT